HVRYGLSRHDYGDGGVHAGGMAGIVGAERDGVLAASVPTMRGIRAVVDDSAIAKVPAAAGASAVNGGDKIHVEAGGDIGVTRLGRGVQWPSGGVVFIATDGRRVDP